MIARPVLQTFTLGALMIVMPVLQTFTLGALMIAKQVFIYSWGFGVI